MFFTTNKCFHFMTSYWHTDVALSPWRSNFHVWRAIPITFPLVYVLNTELFYRLNTTFRHCTTSCCVIFSTYYCIHGMNSTIDCMASEILPKSYSINNYACRAREVARAGRSPVYYNWYVVCVSICRSAADLLQTPPYTCYMTCRCRCGPTWRTSVRRRTWPSRATRIRTTTPSTPSPPTTSSTR
jgi:hypothetical protein